MSQELNLKLSEQVFTAIQLQTNTIGVSPEQLAATLLEHQLSQFWKLYLDESERDIARARFERHFGTLDAVGSLNNENIDADLARKYAGNHE